MENITEQQNQSKAAEEQTEVENEAQTLAIGLPQATEIATAGATAVTPDRSSRQRGDRVFSVIVRAAVWIFLAVLVEVLVEWQAVASCAVALSRRRIWPAEPGYRPGARGGPRCPDAVR